MRVRVIAVGKPGRLLGSAIAEYEARAGRYWSFEAIEVKEEKGREGGEDRVRQVEGDRILQRVGAGDELVALSRSGEGLSSTAFAGMLQAAAASGSDIAFVLGGAFGLAPAVLQRATRTLRLASGTLPHDLARLVLTEQIYRAGTIVRGEPYHKGAE